MGSIRKHMRVGREGERLANLFLLWWELELGRRRQDVGPQCQVRCHPLAAAKAELGFPFLQRRRVCSSRYRLLPPRSCELPGPAGGKQPNAK